MEGYYSQVISHMATHSAKELLGNLGDDIPRVSRLNVVSTGLAMVDTE